MGARRADPKRREGWSGERVGRPRTNEAIEHLFLVSDPSRSQPVSPIVWGRQNRLWARLLSGCNVDQTRRASRAMHHAKPQRSCKVATRRPTRQTTGRPASQDTVPSLSWPIRVPTNPPPRCPVFSHYQSWIWSRSHWAEQLQAIGWEKSRGRAATRRICHRVPG